MVIIRFGWLMDSGNVLWSVSLGLELSETVTVTEEALKTVGVPLNTPLELFKLSPLGNPVALQL